MEKAEHIYEETYAQVKTDDTMEKQAGAAALVITADKLATEWIFQDGKSLTAGEMAEFLKSKESVSVNQRGYEYLCEYVIQNKNHFCGKSDTVEVWGVVECGQACIIRNVFNRICEESGFNSRSLLSWLKKSELIDSNGKGFTRPKRINGEPCNCICMQLPQNEAEDIGIIDED